MIKGGMSRDRFLLMVDMTWRYRGNSHIWWKEPKLCPATLSWAHSGREHVKKVKGLPRSDTDKKTQSQNLRNPTRAPVCTGITLFLWSQHTLSAPKPTCRTTSRMSPGPWWCCRDTMALDGISWEPLKFSFRAAVTNQAGSALTGGGNYANVWVGYCSTGEKVLFQTC